MPITTTIIAGPPRPTAPEDRLRTVAQAGLELAGNKALLLPRDRGFAESLLNTLDVWGSLSPKQEEWLFRLLDRALARAAGRESEAPAVTVGDFSKVYEMFAKAGGRLKWPKIKLTAEGGHAVVLAVAGATSKRAGQVRVTDGRGYGDSRFYGWVREDGTVECPGTRWDEFEAVLAVLRELAGDPEGVARAYGQRYGNCCFCRRELTDKRSVSAGYGPVCAGHFGLPWGEEG